jgi:hypothetical protein
VSATATISYGVKTGADQQPLTREGVMRLYEIKPNHWVNLEFIAGLKYERTPEYDKNGGKVLPIKHRLAITFAKVDDVVELTDATEIRKFSEFAGITDPAIIRKN